jgi:DNA-binding PadR family transcriptional regulator
MDGGKRQGLDDLGRFSEPSLLVLSSLAGGPKHGYAITQDVRAMAGVELGPGTLYGALARLEERGLIEPLPADDRRRPYRLTGPGAAALERRLSALERVAGIGLGRLKGATA